jgi:hypothetical protein
MTCSLSSRISRARGRQPQDCARRQQENVLRPAQMPQCRGVHALVPADFGLTTTHAAIQNP